ncbi:MAG TPA: hypothetical protein VF062_22865 [Candidatus Limnocylindrales bacterium]
MKRNMCLALLVAVTTATVNLAVAAPGSADVECRYSMHHGPSLESTLLAADIPVHVNGITAAKPYNAPFQLVQPHWSIVGLRPLIGTNYDLGLEDCDFGHPHGKSILPGSLVDFLALDGNQPIKSRMFASVSNAGEAVGTFALEYSTGVPLVRGSQRLVMRGTPALVRDVYVPAGTSATIILRPTFGDADLAVVESGSTQDSWVRARADAVQESSQPGLAEEHITLTVPAGTPSRTFGVVVINNAAYTEAILLRA